MKFTLKKIHHLIRYFLVLSVIAFIGYMQRWHDDVFLTLIGPPLYLAHKLKSLLEGTLGAIPHSDTVTFYGFLLPVTILYYGITAYFLKQLWNERGFIRTMTLVALGGFLIFIHYRTWTELTGFFVPNL